MLWYFPVRAPEVSVFPLIHFFFFFSHDDLDRYSPQEGGGADFSTYWKRRRWYFSPSAMCQNLLLALFWDFFPLCICPPFNFTFIFCLFSVSLHIFLSCLLPLLVFSSPIIDVDPKLFYPDPTWFIDPKFSTTTLPIWRRSSNIYISVNPCTFLSSWDFDVPKLADITLEIFHQWSVVLASTCLPIINELA